MALSTRTVTHQFKNPDTTPASGSVIFTLSKRMTNGTTSVVPGLPVTAMLDASGNLSQALYANNDAGTSPTDAQWRVDIRVGNEDSGPYFIVVPSGAGSVDLGTLLTLQPLGG